MNTMRILSTAVLALGLTTATACLGQDTVTGSLGEQSSECTFTQGYWKNHAEAWPVESLTLGDVAYDQDELLAIFDEPVAGNGLIALAHQLIAAKLNVANGAPDDEISDTIEDADALIGGLVVPPIGTGHLDPSVTSDLNDELDAFNNFGPSDCEPTPPACGDGTLDEGEACDDGNGADGDGCSADCTIETTPPACGDGTLDEGEACDDGNGADGDGCSANCTIELPPAVCGNGIVEPGEACDDGNTDNFDQCSNTCTIST